MKFQEMFAKKEVLFIPYFSLGDPSFHDCVHWADALIDGGADILELGIPFSDPIADGPVIQKSYKRALDHTPFQMDLVYKATEVIHKKHPNVPLMYLTYYNPIQRVGVENFLNTVSELGVQGIVIPDLPFDTHDFHNVRQAADKVGISLIQLITLATHKERIRQISENASGFIYFVTSYGVTGERRDFDPKLKEKITMVKKVSGIPVSAGFGISNAEQAEFVSGFADGVIIGSAVQRIIELQGNSAEDCKQSLTAFAKEIKQACVRGKNVGKK